MYDIIIIGAGPAGISSALYTKRSNLNTLIIDSGKTSLEQAHKIENYYGFPAGISGKELYENGLKQAKNLDIEIVSNQVVGISYLEDYYEVKTPTDIYKTKAIIIAIGNKKKTLSIKGIKEFEGRGISYCAICDAFFYKDKEVVIIGNGDFAKEEANILKNVTSKIQILTNGKNLEFENNNFSINTKPIKEITGNNQVEKIIFEDDTTLDVDGIFIALGEAGVIDFSKTLGIITNKDVIKVNESMETNIKGIYACGDAVGGLFQITKSVHEGTIAGLSVVKYIRGEKENGK